MSQTPRPIDMNNLKGYDDKIIFNYQKKRVEDEVINRDKLAMTGNVANQT